MARPPSRASITLASVRESSAAAAAAIDALARVVADPRELDRILASEHTLVWALAKPGEPRPLVSPWEPGESLLSALGGRVGPRELYRGSIAGLSGAIAAAPEALVAAHRSGVWHGVPLADLVRASGSFGPYVSVSIQLWVEALGWSVEEASVLSGATVQSVARARNDWGGNTTGAQHWTVEGVAALRRLVAAAAAWPLPRVQPRAAVRPEVRAVAQAWAAALRPGAVHPLECMGAQLERVGGAGLAWAAASAAHDAPHVVVLLTDARPALPLVCACRAGDACPTLAVAVDDAIAALDGDGPEWEPLRRTLAQPRWAYLLAKVGVGEDAPEPLLGVRLSTGAEGFAAEPVRCTPLARGGFRLARLKKGEVGAFASADDTRLLRLLRDGDNAALLDALQGHPRVFWRSGAADAHRAVQRVDLRIVLDRDAAGDFRFHAELPYAPARFLDALRGLGGTAVWEHAPTGTVRYCTASPAVGAVLEWVADPDHGIPAAHAATASAVASRASRYLPVVLTPGVFGAPRPADARPVLRLSVEGDAVQVQARVRPAPGRLERPGEGVRVFPGADPATGTAVVWERDLDAELAAWGALAARCELPPELAHTLDGDAAAALLLRLQGVGAAVEWAGPARRVHTARRVRVAIGAARDWFGLSGGLDTEAGTASIESVLEALRLGRRFVRLESGDFVAIADELRGALAAVADHARGGAGGPRLSAFAGPAVRALAAAGAEVEAPGPFFALADRLAAAEAAPVALPAGLQAELRPYQAEGVRWLQRTAAWAPGAVLADDMGLGKTLQALGLLLARATLGPALVVAPTSVARGWFAEAARFAPGLTLRDAREPGAPAAGEVRVTTWQKLALDPGFFAETAWATVVLDEAHAIKNADTLRARGARRLGAGFTLALTGTPVENRPAELVSLFAAVAPGLLGPPDDAAAAPAGDDAAAAREAARALGRVVRPLLLRRTKAAVAPDLPPRTELRVDIELSPAERALYTEVQSAAAQIAAGHVAELTDAQARVALLSALTRLRQAACDPSLLALDRPAPPSAKLAALDDLLDTLRAAGERILVFSQFTRLLDRVEARLVARGLRPFRLDGSTPEAERARQVAAFQAGEGEVFLLSLRAGGVGLTLTGASSVILVDPWWNPAVEAQAADRAHRIGQERPVTVYRLVATGTIEEAVLDLHAEKRAMVDAVLDGSGAAATLGTAEILALLLGGGAAPVSPAPAAAPVAAPAADPLSALIDAAVAHLRQAVPPEALPAAAHALERLINEVPPESALRRDTWASRRAKARPGHRAAALDALCAVALG